MGHLFCSLLWGWHACSGSLLPTESITVLLPLCSRLLLDWALSLWRSCSVVAHCRHFVHGGYRKLNCRFCCFVIRAQRDKPKENTENIPPKKRRYRCVKEAFASILMNIESISCKCKTRTTSERHDNKKIPETTEGKNHIDDGGRPAATKIGGDEESKIYEPSQPPEAMKVTMVLVSCSVALSFPRNRRPRFTHDNDEKRLLLRQSKQSTTKEG